MSDARLTGDDVIGLPGQNLLPDEQLVLTWLADGRKPSEIEQALNITRVEMRQIESNITAKLGARSKSHMIARAFVLNVLAPRALCLILAIASGGAGFVDHMSATRVPQRSRTPVSSARITRIRRDNTNGGGDLPDIDSVMMRYA
ncbi:hypothetical protein GCM10010082_31470 [Kushneria pakistanensis]|uniref:HTH luxR-type domain-containing protein n=1 Tax=Kushneria pakistanensis TaxID=1508770 RepID=A0ABQ3FRW8_9GAMM|nr:hypothetical protein [Kushneria pakistanensis]GHC34509.1 hypothetical protein GCM10010082_31470 [Kushneria pakistanensis]